MAQKGNKGYKAQYSIWDTKNKSYVEGGFQSKYAAIKTAEIYNHLADNPTRFFAYKDPVALIKEGEED